MNERETIASGIFAHNYVVKHLRRKEGVHMSPRKCFKAADFFIREMEKQRTVAKDARVECEHDWGYTNHGPKCLKCDTMKYAPKVVEKIEAREWHLYKWADSIVRAVPSDITVVKYSGYTAPVHLCKVREVLE